MVLVSTIYMYGASGEKQIGCPCESNTLFFHLIMETRQAISIFIVREVIQFYNGFTFKLRLCPL